MFLHILLIFLYLKINSSFLFGAGDYKSEVEIGYNKICEELIPPNNGWNITRDTNHMV